jgi:hypothetical protein
MVIVMLVTRTPESQTASSCQLQRPVDMPACLQREQGNVAQTYHNCPNSCRERQDRGVHQFGPIEHRAQEIGLHGEAADPQVHTLSHAAGGAFSHLAEEAVAGEYGSVQRRPHWIFCHAHSSTCFRLALPSRLQGYDISFLITNKHLESMWRHKLVDFVIQFMQDIDREISAMKISVNARARAIGKELMQELA